MAVSKHQNERPAIDALIDLANQLEGESATHAQNIETLTEGLADEVRDREAADTGLQNQLGGGFEHMSVTQSLNATNQQVQLLGDAEAAIAEDVSGILATLNNIKFGFTLELTVPASDTYEGTYDYPDPFPVAATSLVMIGFADDPSHPTLSLDLLDYDYSGFSYSITNTDTDPATVTVGYLAIASFLS